MFYDVGLISVFVVRIFLEILEMYESHSCAWMCIVIATFCAGFGSCLYVRVSGGFSLNETSCAISASVRTLNVPVLLMTIGVKMISVRF
jgi:hypothetical protein